MVAGKKSKFDLSVSARVNKLRLAKGYTQDDLAAVLGCTRFYISRLESANDKKGYNLEHLNRIAFELDCTLWDLIPERPLQEDDWE